MNVNDGSKDATATSGARLCRVLLLLPVNTKNTKTKTALRSEREACTSLHGSIKTSFRAYSYYNRTGVYLLQTAAGARPVLPHTFDALADVGMINVYISPYNFGNGPICNGQ